MLTIDYYWIAWVIPMYDLSGNLGRKEVSDVPTYVCSFLPL